MTTLEVLARRLDQVESQLALHRLAYRYCVGADHRDIDTWTSVWLPDAEWQVSPDRVFAGIRAIRDAVQQQWAAFPVMQHSTTNHTIEVNGDRATGRSDVVVMVQLGDRIIEDAGRWVVGGGTYLDDYLRLDGEWRIARRRVDRPFDLAPLAPSIGHPEQGQD